MMMNNVNNNEV